jgi:MFS family permease
MNASGESRGARAIMLGGGVMVALALAGINSILPQIEADLARGPEDSLLIKQLVGIVALSMVAGAPLAGFLIDRIGARRVVIVASFLYALFGTAGVYLTDLHALLVSRLLLGMAAVAITTTSMTMINTGFSGVERARLMGVHTGVAMIGSIVIHPISGGLGELGWRWPFALYALGLVFAFLALGLDRHDAPRAAPATAAVKGPSLLTWFPFRYAVLAVLIGAITYIPMVYIPYLMRELGTTSPTVISLALTGDVALGATLAILYGRARKHIPIHVAFAFSFACTGVGSLLTAYAGSLVGIILGMAVFGIGLGWFTPNLMTAVAQLVKAEQQGRATGLVKGAHHLAAPLAIVAVEPIVRRLGPDSAMMVAASIAFSLLILVLLAHRRERAAAMVAKA